MIIYNVTVQINHEVEEDWVKWMRTHHIPDVIKTEQFTSHRFCRLISHQEQSQGTSTYAIQYFAQSMKNIHNYQVNFAKKLQEEHTEKYKDKFLAFRTLLEIID